jgi:hypothetical protein
MAMSIAKEPKVLCSCWHSGYFCNFYFVGTISFLLKSFSFLPSSLSALSPLKGNLFSVLPNKPTANLFLSFIRDPMAST